MKSNFGFILIKPQLSENIGACARSLKNFGFSKLFIVSPKNPFPDPKVKATSVGAYDIIKRAKVYDNVYKAIDKFNIIVSLSARKRDINKKHISISNLEKLIGFNNTKKIGFMFGPEASGLSNQDLSFSNYINIKDDENYIELTISSKRISKVGEPPKLFDFGPGRVVDTGAIRRALELFIETYVEGNK